MKSVSSQTLGSPFILENHKSEALVSLYRYCISCFAFVNLFQWIRVIYNKTKGLCLPVFFLTKLSIVRIADVRINGAEFYRDRLVSKNLAHTVGCLFATPTTYSWWVSSRKMEEVSGRDCLLRLLSFLSEGTFVNLSRFSTHFAER